MIRKLPPQACPILQGLAYEAAGASALLYHGVRKIVPTLFYSIPGPLPVPQLNSLGYSGPAKLRALQRLYYDPLEVEKAKAMILKRQGKSHSSVALRLRGQEKDQRSQGHCMQTMVITFHEKAPGCSVGITYRSTEVVQKFSADLVLIDQMFRDLQIVPHTINFYFENAYLSAVFLPTLFRFSDPVKFLTYLGEQDAHFHSIACRTLSRFLDPRGRFSYKARVVQQDILRKLPQPTLDELNGYLLSVIKEYHEKNMPELDIDAEDEE